MTKISKLSILGTATLALGLAGCVQMPGGDDAAIFGEGASDVATITFLHTNDVYVIDAEEGSGGGMAELMTVLKAARAGSPNSITTFGGDLFSPSVMSGLTQGAQMVDFYNRLGTDVAVLGNHEFDFGPDVAAERIGESDFPWLGTNVLGADGNPAVGAKAGLIIEKAGYKVGFFGVLAPETDELSSPGDDIEITAPIDAAAAAVESLEEQGADLIVALTHDDLADDRRLLREVDGIDLVLGGHDHDPISIVESGTLIGKAGYDAHYVLAVDLKVARVQDDDEEVIEILPSWRFISTAGVAPDAATKAVVDAYNADLDKDLDVAVGTTTVALDSQRSTVRSEESNMGNLIADAARETLGADVSIANGGGIRGDRTYDAGTTLTRKDILSELPFGNTAVLIALSGADLLAAIENGVSQVEDTAGRFPQVSGMRYTYDAAKAPGERVTEMTVGGAALDPNATYKVAINDYIYGGGDGYEALTRGTAIVDPSGAVLLASVVMDYIEAKGEVAPAVEGRITRLN
ncbi:MAG: 5'-nucleotidase C-terminal domain-containing protein [Alphaproteobacteria bacterium]|nr:5'-nucleotidase C-terminal domain-containing protein [Alphaproteobacteria bacterium]